jgi:hypothetical protein
VNGVVGGYGIWRDSQAAQVRKKRGVMDPRRGIWKEDTAVRFGKKASLRVERYRLATKPLATVPAPAMLCAYHILQAQDRVVDGACTIVSNPSVLFPSL